MIVAHGDVRPEDKAALAGAHLVVAADGGAFALEAWGAAPHAIVGDLDSLGAGRAEEYHRRGVTVVPFAAEKDESDLELAVRHALEQGADDLVLLGIFGGPRFDHELANALLLADGAYRGVRVAARYGPVTARPLHGGERLELDGRAGDTVTLLAVNGDAEGVRTSGLRYPLAGEPIRFGRSRGLSNVVTSPPASVSCERGVLLVIQTRDGGVS